MTVQQQALFLAKKAKEELAKRLSNQSRSFGERSEQRFKSSTGNCRIGNFIIVDYYPKYHI